MKKPRTIIRIGRQTLTFALPENPEATGGSKRGAKVMLEPYTVKSGMSMAANLREAFKESALLAIPNERVHVIIDTPTLILPIEEFDENNMEELYRYTFPGGIHEVIVHHVMPELNCVAVFAINKDVRLVVTDHFDNVRITPVDSHGAISMREVIAVRQRSCMRSSMKGEYLLRASRRIGSGS